MCTVIFDRKLNLLAKNRDKNTPNDEEIISDENFVAVKTKGADYYSLGLNRHGCAFVSTAINTPEWTKLAGLGLVEEAQKQADKENQGLFAATKVLSETLPQVKSVHEWAQMLKSGKLPWKGYHAILVDKKDAVVLELYKDQFHERKLEDKDFIVNHFATLKHGPQKYEDYPNTFERYKYAQSSLDKINSLADLQETLHPADLARREKIWRTGHFFTVSSTIIDLNRLGLYFTGNIDHPYRFIPL